MAQRKIAVEDLPEDDGDDFVFGADLPQAFDADAGDGDDFVFSQELAPLSDQGGEEGGGFLSGLSKVLDFTGGVTRTALAQGPANLSGALRFVGDQFDIDLLKKLPTTEEILPVAELISALQLEGMFPTTGDILERSGVPEGPKAFGVSARGAAGFLGDVGLDLGNLLGGAGAVKQVGKLFSRSAIKDLAATSVKRGKEAKDVFEIFARQGISGTKNGVVKKLGVKISKLSKEADTIVGQAAKKGGVVDTAKAFAGADAEVVRMVRANSLTGPEGLALLKTLRGGMATQDRDVLAAVAKMLKKTKGTDDAADVLEAIAPALTSVDRKVITVEAANTFKQAFAERIKANAFNTGKRVPFDQRVLKFARGGFQEGVEESAEKVLGRGSRVKLAKTNKDLGVLIEAEPLAVARAAGDRSLLRSLTRFETMGAMGGGALGGIPGAISTAATFRGLEAIGTPGVKSFVGKGLTVAGKLGEPVEPFIKRLLIDAERPPTTGVTPQQQKDFDAKGKALRSTVRQGGEDIQKFFGGGGIQKLLDDELFFTNPFKEGQ